MTTPTCDRLLLTRRRLGSSWLLVKLDQQEGNIEGVRFTRMQNTRTSVTCSLGHFHSALWFPIPLSTAEPLQVSIVSHLIVHFSSGGTLWDCLVPISPTGKKNNYLLFLMMDINGGACAGLFSTWAFALLQGKYYLHL